MTNQTTVMKMHEMRLSAMVKEYEMQLVNPQFQALSFEERFNLLIDTEYERRRNNKLSRLLHQAQFRYPAACVEDIEYHADRQLDQAQLLRLASSEYIQKRRNVIIKGASGNGKSYLACALGVAACRLFYKVKYIRLPDLLDELEVARGEGMYQKVIKSYKKIELLIIDEWLLLPLRESQARELLELVEGRHQRASTIYCSQFDIEGWYEKIGEEPVADAIMDRIVHDSYHVFIDGKQSMRERHGVQRDG